MHVLGVRHMACYSFLIFTAVLEKLFKDREAEDAGGKTNAPKGLVFK